MKKEYDILVIGSGLGGLVSALILSKEGYNVCVLEKNNQYGGNLQTFARDKLIFDTGVHYIGGLSDGQNLNLYFHYLGIMNDLKIKQMDEIGFDKITFDNDPIEYPHSQGYANFIEQLSRLFPEELENITRYCDEVRNICNQFSRYNLVGEGKYNDDILYLNARDVIESITSNPKLQSVLAGSNFLYAGNSKTPFYVHALTINSYIQSAYKCLNGGSQISKLLIKQLRVYKVDLFKHCDVSEMILDDNQCLKSVKTKNGKEFFAKKFISNIEIKTTLDLVGHKHFKKSFIKRIHALEPISSCFSVYIVLKPKTLKHFNHNYYHIRSENQVWNQSEYQEEQWPKSYMLSSSESKNNSEFSESLTILTYMKYEDVKGWENSFNTVLENSQRSQDYENFKIEKARRLIALVEEKFPDLSSLILGFYTSSPLSYRDYIGSYNGNMYGYRKESSNPLKTIFSPRTKISNLFMTGQSVNMHGILGCTIGAFNTCSEIVGKELINERLKDLIQRKK